MLTHEPPPWPVGVPKIWAPLARVQLPPRRPVRRRCCLPHLLDDIALERAGSVQNQAHALQASAVTGTWTETLFAERADFAALASSASEGTLLSGNLQPYLPAGFFLQGGGGAAGNGRAIGLHAAGVFSNTGTPTLTFQVRASSTSGTTTLSGVSLGVSAAITTGSGVSNKMWELWLELVLRTPGIGTNNATLSGAGWVMSPGGFAAPYIYALQPTTPDTATWTATLDASLTQWLNLSATWSASSASNTITCKLLRLYGRN